MGSRLLVLVLALALGACANDGGNTKDNAATRTVAIETFAFVPEAIEIDVGTSVTFVNRDDILHTVTSGRPKRQGIPGVSSDRTARPDGLFDEELGLDESFAATLQEPGVITYYCDIHAGMKGRIVVV